MLGLPRPSSWTVPLLLLASCALLLPRPLLADEADDQYAVAAGLYARQQWKLAVHEFQVFAEKYPNHPKLKQSIFFTAEALVQLGQSEEATARFREYLKRDPSGPYARSARFRAGEAFYLAGKLDQAKAELRAFVEKYPADDLNAYALPYLGDIALAQKDIAAAENYFRQGLSRFPQGQRQDDCRFGLGRALEKQDKNEEAERLYLAVAAKTGIPLAADAQFRLGAVQYAMGKYHEAIELFAAFETRLAGSPRQPAARLGHGWALMKLGKPAEAGKVFEQIVGDEKLGIEARYWLGLSQKAQKTGRAPPRRFWPPPRPIRATALSPRCDSMRETRYSWPARRRQPAESSTRFSPPAGRMSGSSARCTGRLPSPCWKKTTSRSTGMPPSSPAVFLTAI